MTEILHSLVPFAVFGLPAAVVVAFRWFKYQERMSERMSAQIGHGQHAVDARLARLEQTLETMAVEMERLGEGQRFVTRLLAERTPMPVVEARTSRQRMPTPS